MVHYYYTVGTRWDIYDYSEETEEYSISGSSNEYAIGVVGQLGIEAFIGCEVLE